MGQGTEGMRNAGASGHAMIGIRRREASPSLTERIHSWLRPGVPEKKGRYFNFSVSLPGHKRRFCCGGDRHFFGWLCNQARLLRILKAPFWKFANSFPVGYGMEKKEFLGKDTVPRRLTLKNHQPAIQRRLHLFPR